VYALTERVTRTLWSTNARGDIAWWLDPASSRTYWRLNLDALRRGIAIKRIFIYEEWTPALDALARFQHERGVCVLRVSEDQLPSSLRLNTIIWDGNCGYEPVYSPSGERIGSSFTFASQDLAVMHDKFKLIESCSEAYPD
jgi:hypothetical protein